MNQQEIGLLKLSKKEGDNFKRARLTEIKLHPTKPAEKKLGSDTMKIYQASKPSLFFEKNDSKRETLSMKSANNMFKVASKPLQKFDSIQLLEDVEKNEHMFKEICFNVASKPRLNHLQENKGKNIKSIFLDSEDVSIVNVMSLRGKQENKVQSINNLHLKQVIHNFGLKAASGDNCLSFPSIDELLRIPDPDGQMSDNSLDALDVEIAQSRKKFEEEMAKVDSSIAAEKQRQEERNIRFKENDILRNRLEEEITEPVLRRMFSENILYLLNISEGKVKSIRNEAFHKSCKTRHGLFYQMITDPFTDDHLSWTLQELSQVWMKTEKEYMDNNELVWKVLMPEFFIKVYMDHFGFQKKDAEKRISETPLKDEDTTGNGGL